MEHSLKHQKEAVGLSATESDLDQVLQQWSSLVHSAPEIIMLVLSDGRIIYTNRPWISETVSETVGSDLLNLIPMEERAKVSSCLARTFEFGGLETCVIGLNNQHEEHWFSLRFSRVDKTGSDFANGNEQAILIISEITETKLAEAMLRGLSARSEEIREDERVRIAREIHDELGQLLTVLKMDLAWLKAKMTRGTEPVRQRMEQMDQSLNTMIQSVRRIASELGPPMLRDLGLIPALEWQLNQFQQRSGIDCHIDIRLSDVRIPSEATTAIFRVVQEALTNIARHADARNVEFFLDDKDQELLVSIADDGKGIQPEALKGASAFGVNGMRERIHRLGGQFNIESRPTGGTIISVRVPTGA